MTDPRASDEDLTAKARIRNAALDLYAERGEDRVSMRAVAAAAGVAVGLVQHHFKTKDGLRVAVEQLVGEGEAEGDRFARAGLGRDDQVAALRLVGNHRGLDFGQRVVRTHGERRGERRMKI